MKPVDFSRIVIARKLSLLEYDIDKLVVSREEIIKEYEKKGVDPKHIMEAHDSQREVFSEAVKYLENPRILEGRNLEKRSFEDASLVVVLGGDNYFQYVSSFLDSQLVVGINSDPKRSEGVMTCFDVGSFGELVDKLKSGNFRIEEWSRLQVKIDGMKLPFLVSSEVYIGSQERFNISRYLLKFKGSEEEQKSSGVLVATGAGSTGWYRSAVSCEHQNQVTFSRTAKEARFFVTEIFKGKLHKGGIDRGVIKSGDKLIIKSLGKYQCVVSLDSKTNFDFERGREVEIGLADVFLNVIVG